MAKTCKKGYYYCYTSKKCKKIPVGHHVMPSGRLMKDGEHEEKEGGEESTETKKNGNGSNGDGGAVSEGWSEKYKKSIDCKNPKGFSQRAHCQGRKKVEEAKNYEKDDHEVSMAQTQLKKSEENIRKLRKALGTKEKNIPAWVQAKITDTEHNTDAASSYMDEGKRDGKSAKDRDYSLHDWFKGGGWVQAGGKYDGKPCAKQPGQKTKPFCRDADDRASMSKKERNRRAAKKRREDPNPDRKGKAKNVTEVYDTRGTKYKGDPIKALEDTPQFKQQGGKVVKPAPVKLANSFSNWRGEIELDENALVKLGLGVGGTIAAGVGLGKMMDNFVKDQRKTKPKDYAVKTGLGAYAAKARNAGQLGEQTKPLDKKYKKQKPGLANIPTPELDKNPLSNDPIIRRASRKSASYDNVYYDEETVSEKCWDGYEQKGMKKKGKKVVPNCVPVGEEVVSEEGKKDACYKKVKARYDVWPSAYASGALVKCRKVGAANWGNKSKKENFSDWKSDMLLSESGFKDMGPEDFKRYLNSLNSDQARDLAKKAYAKKNPAASRSINPSMDVSKTRTTPSAGGPQMPNVNRDAKWNRGQNFRDPRAQQVYDHMTRTRVDAAAETAAAQASKNAAQARRAARSGGGLFSRLKPLVKPTLNLIRKNKYGALAAGGAMAAAYGLGKLQNSFSRAPKNESVSIENSDGKTFAEVIDIIGPAQMQTATNQNGVWAGTTQLSNWRDELSEVHRPPAGWKPYGGNEKGPVPEVDATANRIDAIRKSIKTTKTMKEDWQKVNKKDKTDGMSQKAVDAYKRENPGSKLKTAVTEKNPGGKRAKRRKSFCARSNGQREMHNIDCSKTPDKAICKARKRWRC